ncbi:aspartate racemase [Chania multitudinisentens RB-25]|uniref:Aspartate racemase n=1 Tax=Chania multitudinisentens RB-25 TaxID=1441930 RepID=W0LC13_9GAMM|nr:amino acid racemase [Chania multitudinisentens]AHG21368.1 aspartate racemase [Chania multitudinisentens RB-25]
MTETLLFGVLGGMGPLATLDLLQKMIEAMPAKRDQEHLPVVTWNVPQIPDRQKALAGKGESPLPQLLHAVQQLNRLNVSHIAIPCNTAHHWYPQLAAASRAPILHLVDIAAAQIAHLHPRPQRVGIIATEATLQAGWYQQRLAALGIDVILPTEQELRTLFVPGCYAVKRGENTLGGQLLQELATALINRGAEKLVLACTEIPLAFNAVASPLRAASVDPAYALAQHCVALWQCFMREAHH